MYHEQIPITVNGQTARIFSYILYHSPEIEPKRVRPLVIISPGGGYAFTSDREAEPIAIQFNAMGFHAMVLHYSTPACYPTPVLQLASAVKYARQHAQEWGVDTQKIVLCGFSAGGHLTAWMGNHWNRDYVKHALRDDAELWRPNGLILCYPVISGGEFGHQDSFCNLLQDRLEEKRQDLSMETQVSADTPPTFLWHTAADELVPVENSLLMAAALRRHGIPFEMHVYPEGIHGMALANEETMYSDGRGIQPECQNWIRLAGSWIQRL